MNTPIPLGIVLTGGVGSRMAPLNRIRPKAVMPFCNTPLLEYQLRTAGRLGARRVLLGVGPASEAMIRDYMRQRQPRCDESPPEISWLVDEDPSDYSLRLIQHELTTDSAILNCDTILEYPLDALCGYHRSGERICTWALVPAPLGEEHQASAWYHDATGRLTHYTRHGQPGSYTQAGIVIVSPSFVEQLMRPTERCPFDFGDEEPWLGCKPLSAPFWARARRLRFTPDAGWFAYSANGYGRDVGTPDRYLRAHCDALSGRIPFIGREEYRVIAPGGWVHPSAQIDAGAVLEPPFLIGPGARVGADARLGPFAVLGNDATVAGGGAVAHSVVWDRVTIASGVALNRCVVGDGVRVEQSESAMLLTTEDGDSGRRDISAAVADLDRLAIGARDPGPRLHRRLEYRPRHAALIPDGNRRWAVMQGISVHESTQCSVRLMERFARFMFAHGVEAVSGYASATINYRNRPREEVQVLEDLLIDTIEHHLLPVAREHGAAIRHAGRTDLLGPALIACLEAARRETCGNTQRRIYILAGYGAADEIDAAFRRKPEDAPLSIEHLWVPEPVHLIIRTSNNQRISEMLPLQAGYAEVIFTEKYPAQITDRELAGFLEEYDQRLRFKHHYLDALHGGDA